MRRLRRYRLCSHYWSARWVTGFLEDLAAGLFIAGELLAVGGGP